MTHIISIINNKGGTGKTTTSLNFGHALALMDYRVLLVDLDSQCNLSSAFGISHPENHLGKVLMGSIPIKDAIESKNGMDLIPSASNLLDYETHINAEPGREYLMREAIAPVLGNYDFIIFDCPPSLGTLSINSLVASDYFLVPMQAENFAFIGLDNILITADKVRSRLNQKLEMAGVLLVKFTDRTKFSRAVKKNLEDNEQTGHKLFKTHIRQDISLMESAAFHQPVFNYAPRSRGAEDYNRLANEFIQMYGKA